MCEGVCVRVCVLCVCVLRVYEDVCKSMRECKMYKH